MKIVPDSYKEQNLLNRVIMMMCPRLSKFEVCKRQHERGITNPTSRVSVLDLQLRSLLRGINAPNEGNATVPKTLFFLSVFHFEVGKMIDLDRFEKIGGPAG